MDVERETTAVLIGGPCDGQILILPAELETLMVPIDDAEQSVTRYRRTAQLPGGSVHYNWAPG
jgi:hypothetical protein